MSVTLTRRDVAAALLSPLMPLSSRPADAAPLPADPILELIEAHRAAIANDRRASAALAHARAANTPDLAEIAAERKRTCKLRHSRRRDLRRATPTTGEGFRALHRHYTSLVPAGEDRDGIRERCRLDFAEAVARYEGRAQA